MDSDDDVPIERRVFAKNFRKARMSRNMTQAEVSRLIGMDKSYISDIERCTANPTLNIMARLAAAVRVDLCELLRSLPAPGCDTNASKST